jgi:hypothetical protein
VIHDKSEDRATDHTPDEVSTEFEKVTSAELCGLVITDHGYSRRAADDDTALTLAANLSQRQRTPSAGRWARTGGWQAVVISQRPFFVRYISGRS